jgi:hypothetical protein
MGDFAIVGEGPTDQLVIDSIIQAFYDGRAVEPDIVFEQPPIDRTGLAGLDPEPGGWTLVIKYLRDRKYLQALQLNRYIVVQIDTDIAGDLGISRPTATTDDELVGMIVQHLTSCIAEEDRPLVEGRILFAIGLDEIECWLLSAVFDRSEKTHLGKTTGCLEAIDRKLLKRNREPLSKSEKSGGKNLRRYREVCRNFRRRRDLDSIVNPGFTRFLQDLVAHPLDEG